MPDIEFLSSAALSTRIRTGPATFELKGDPATGPSLVTSGSLKTLELPDGSTKAVVFALRVPTDMNRTKAASIELRFAPTNLGTGDGNIRLQLEGRYVVETEQIDKTPDETVLQTEAVINTLDEMHVITIPIDKDLITDTVNYLVFVLSRLGLDGLDTYDGDTGFYVDSGLLIYNR